MATLAALVKRVRRIVGNPDTTDVPDDVIQDILNIDALTWLNHQDPNAVLTHFVTVANQQYYDAKPAAAYDVYGVAWDACNYINLGGNLRFFPEGYEMNRQLAGFDVLSNPGLVRIFFKEVESYKQNFGGEGYEMPDGTIGLFPTPGTAGEMVYFWYTIARYSAVTGIRDGSEHQEGLVKKAGSMLAGQPMFIKRGRVRSGRTFAGGGGANEDTLAGRLSEEAEAHVPGELLGQISTG